MRQLLDLVKVIGEKNKLSIDIDKNNVKYETPIQIENTEDDEIDYVEEYEDDFSWLDINTDVTVDCSYTVNYPVDKYEIEKERLYGAFLTGSRTISNEIDCNEDYYERERRLNRQYCKFLTK